MTKTKSEKNKTLYEQLGHQTIRAVVSLFYERAFQDVLLAHFFFGKDHAYLIDRQVEFTSALLGSKKGYSGKPLLHIHKGLAIRPPHFKRRQVLLAEVLNELAISPHISQSWLEREDQLAPLILSRSEKFDTMKKNAQRPPDHGKV